MSSPRSDDEQTTLSSEDRELLSRAGVGLTAPKPISVWIAQIIFALAALANLVVGLGGLAVNPFAAVVALVVAAFLVALIVAGQVRRMGATAVEVLGRLRSGRRNAVVRWSGDLSRG
jgi:hypothetical protein